MDAEDRGRADVAFRSRWVSGLIVMVVVGVTVVVLFVWVFPWVVSLQQDPMLGTQMLHRPGQSATVQDAPPDHNSQKS